MKRRAKTVALILMITMFISLLVPVEAKADSKYPNVVTTYIGYELTSTVDVNFNAGSITGLIGRSPLSDFWWTGLTEEDIAKDYKPVVYTSECSLETSVTDALRAKATEIGAERVVTFVDIFLFANTTESIFVPSYPNYVEYTIKLPSNIDSSEMEYAVICYYDGRMQLFKDTDDDYSTLTFSTNKSAPYTILRAWDGTFDNIENGAYIDGTAEATTTTDADELDDVPKTGQTNVLLFLSIAAIISGGCYVYLDKKEKLV